jgi:hypothetical protein
MLSALNLMFENFVPGEVPGRFLSQPQPAPGETESTCALAQLNPSQAPTAKKISTVFNMMDRMLDDNANQIARCLS